MNKREDIEKWDQTGSPETPDRGETSEIPGLPLTKCQVFTVHASVLSKLGTLLNLCKKYFEQLAFSIHIKQVPTCMPSTFLLLWAPTFCSQHAETVLVILVCTVNTNTFLTKQNTQEVKNERFLDKRMCTFSAYVAFNKASFQTRSLRGRELFNCDLQQ